MRKITALFLLFCAMSAANAGYDNERFRQEVLKGLDIVSAKDTAYTEEDDAPGELGLDVYQKKNNLSADDLAMYIPNDMYVRAGGGVNLGFISDKSKVAGADAELSGGWSAQMGLGWNLSSYVRAEVDFQVQNFGFSGYDDLIATARSLGGTLYFDFARRYVMTGDITRRRTFVPFMGLGFGAGAYKFEGAGGTGGGFVAPRGILGVNLMLTDLFGIDLSYQYQMFVGQGFGWNVRNGGVQNLSDIMLSARFNF
ncbi:MAG: hypothetical protein LBD50_02580 [Rickettsiales bacterium]|jgi:hypothetical protein|nr:hypothetical protein [Rickettsiales bacterium]